MIENNEIKKIKAFILKIFVINPFMKLLDINLDFLDVFNSLLNDEIPINIKQKDPNIDIRSPAILFESNKVDIPNIAS